MRGEQATGIIGVEVPGGSSPHARGAAAHPSAISPANRIIPACAGSSVRCSEKRTAARDHPRMRGEQPAALAKHIAGLGSSPHARGAAACPRTQRTGSGIIPACAGSRDIFAESHYSPPDHPRMRGEQPDLCRYQTHPQGSSPHARGAGSICTSKIQQYRIIPACAGSSPGPA